MTASRGTRIKLFAFVAIVAALGVATFTRPSRDVREDVDSEIAAARSESARQHAHAPIARHSGVDSTEAGGAAPAPPAFAGAQLPLDPEEHARRREERLAVRAAQRATWEERKREARSTARARALEHAKDDAAQVEYLKAKFARRDESERLLEERREARRKKREERAARPGDALPRPSDAPLLGAPVLGKDGVAYDPHARAP